MLMNLGLPRYGWPLKRLLIMARLNNADSSARAEEIDFFISIQLPVEDMCRSLNLSPQALHQWARRHGYHDVAEKLRILAYRDQNERKLRRTDV